MGSCKWERHFSPGFSVLDDHQHTSSTPINQPLDILITADAYIVHTLPRTMAADRPTLQQLLAKLQSTPRATPVRITPVGACNREYCLGCQSFVAIAAQCRHCNGRYCSKYMTSPF